MDKEEFQAWKDSPATQWVLQWLQTKASEVEEGLKQRLSLSTGLDPAQWQALQPLAAHDAGYVRAIGELVDLEFTDIVPEEEKEKGQ